jgi:uncharacterized protein (DUF58 family)
VTRALAAGSLGALLALTAAAFDSPSLYVPGVALLLLAAGAALWVWLAAAGARIRRRVEVATVEEGNPCRIEVAAAAGSLPPPGGALVEPLFTAPVPVAWRRRREVHLSARFPRRGRRTLAPARLVVRDPLGLAAREVATGMDEVLVLPRVEPVVVLHPAGGGGSGAALTALLDAQAAELELDSLRPYREGAPASRIHWPTVARTAEMVERRLTADTEHRPLVVLDPRRPASEEALDRAVRAAASLSVDLARAGGCALLLPGDRHPSEIDPALRAWPRLHARLALVEPGDGGPATLPDRAAAVFWVTAAAAPAVGSALLRRAGAGRYLVTPVPAAGATASFTVAGCTGQRLDRRPLRSAA